MPAPTQAVRTFGVACYRTGPDYASTVYWHLVLFEMMPVWLLVFNGIFSLISRDIFFFVASNVSLTAYYWFYRELARVIASPRPPDYDWQLCNAEQFALPDALFVSTLSYALLVGAGLFINRRLRRLVGATFALTSAGAFGAYFLSVVVNGYMYGWQLAVNVGVAAVSSVYLLLVYWLLWHRYDCCGGARRRLEQELGFSDDLFDSNAARRRKK